jgi:hypothetical protein
VPDEQNILTRHLERRAKLNSNLAVLRSKLTQCEQMIWIWAAIGKKLRARSLDYYWLLHDAGIRPPRNSIEKECPGSYVAAFYDYEMEEEYLSEEIYDVPKSPLIA